MFNRKLYEVMGGFDEELDLLEDWDLWVRYSLKSNFLFVPKCTSLYRVPANNEERQKRHLKLYSALEAVREKHNNLLSCSSIKEIRCELESILNSNNVH